MLRTRAVVLVLGYALALGCDPLDAEPAPLCTDGAGCPPGSRCVDGVRCVAGPDASTPPRFDLAQPPTVGPPTGPPGRRDAGTDRRDGGFARDGGLDRRDAGSERCVPGQTRCFSECVSLENDPNNCGGCGVRCLAEETCRLGVCCDALRTICDGECVDTFSDRDHCGVCNLACGVGASCVVGICSPDDVPVT